VRPLFRDLYLIGNQSEPYRRYNLPVMPDLFPEGGALAGLHAGLRAGREQRCFIIAGDMPFLTRELIVHLASLPMASPALVPRPPRGPQPLCAIYDKSVAALAEKRLMRRQFDLEGFALAAQATLVNLRDFAEPKVLDHLFLDIDGPEDLRLAETLVVSLRQQRPSERP